MPTTELTAETFESTVLNNDTVLVDWWASWCGPCKQFAPIFEDASEQNPDIVFAKVDTEGQPQLAGQAQITSIPTLMAFREGILVFSQPGALPAPALADLISQVQALDMDDVRRQIAETQGGADGQGPDGDQPRA